MARQLLAVERLYWKAAGVLVYNFSADGRLRLLLGRSWNPPRGARYANIECWTLLGALAAVLDPRPSASCQCCQRALPAGGS